ncbi:MAG: hypothetical protein Q9185_006830 [Variospora sp. 1 TL-2023]
MSAIAIVDTHVHLYPRAELQSLAWCDEGNPLHSQHSVDEYLDATQGLSKISNQEVRGFIFIETDRKSSLDSEAGWEEPLRELDWIKRIADGTPRPGEGHGPEHAPLCLGIVPWAPIPSGSEAMSRYVHVASSRVGSSWRLVKGFRYLVQDKPPGTMLSKGFIASLKWMGRSSYAFDLGVDVRSGGLWQLREAREMVENAHQGLPEKEKVVIVISMLHLMHDRDLNGNPNTDAFDGWRLEMSRLAACANVYVKISGGFSEINTLPNGSEQGAPGSYTRDHLLQDIRNWVERWLKETLMIFGPRRLMWGSDWPVCNIGGGGNEVSWMNWWSLIRAFVADNMTREDQTDFWSGNALKAYSRGGSQEVEPA